MAMSMSNAVCVRQSFHLIGWGPDKCQATLAQSWPSPACSYLPHPQCRPFSALSGSRRRNFWGRQHTSESYQHHLPLTRWRDASKGPRAQSADTSSTAKESVPAGSVSVVLLAGGVGKRMGAAMPKQYLPIRDQPIALYSLALFASLAEVGEIVVVCDSSYRQLFEDAIRSSGRTLQFASPGKERQDSVFNGLQEIQSSAELVCVHDSARPLLTQEDARAVFRDAREHGAAVLGVPVKQTIKEAAAGGFVSRTLDRSKLWEMQTPQVIKPDLLRRGFEHVRRENLEVTDDVSIVEYLNAPVKITQGSYTNLKVTTPEDLLLAEKLIAEAEEQQAEQAVGSGVHAVHVEDLTLQQV